MEYLVFDFSSGENKNNNGGAHFTMDDLLDFTKEEEEVISDPDGFLVNSNHSSNLTPVESCNSSVSGVPEKVHCEVKFPCRSSVTDSSSQFPGSELCIPYDEDLEWLSNFVEESFSNDLGCVIPATGTDTSSSITPIPVPVQVPQPPMTFPSDVSVPGKARSKRPRAPPYDLSSRLLHVAGKKKHESDGAAGNNDNVETAPTGRKCLHCATEKTPQWRTGPMGPKTLCNACGVRYKSGRLVPEYRPAASPTFVSNKHSNSHRKVMELRRQKDQQRQQFIGRVSVFNGCDDFMIHHHNAIINGQDLRHMI